MRRDRTPTRPALPTRAARLRAPVRAATLVGAALLVTLAAASLVAAQTPATGEAAVQAGLSGTWDVTWDQAIRTAGNRVLKVQRRGTAVLILEQHGDSLAGTWTIAGVDQTHRVVGTVRDDSLALHAPDAVIRDGGRTAAVTMRWFGVLENGEIAGTMYLRAW